MTKLGSAQMTATVGKGEGGPSDVTYPVTISNIGVQSRGPLTLPAGYTVLAATGQGYQDVTNNVATWKLARSAPKEQEKLTITLSQPLLIQGATPAGTLKWAKHHLL